MTRITEKPSYTTGEVARVFGVATRTATKWIDRGLLRGYRLPGSLERRTTRAWMEEFAEKHGVPLDFSRLEDQ